MFSEIGFGVFAHLREFVYGRLANVQSFVNELKVVTDCSPHHQIVG